MKEDELAVIEIYKSIAFLIEYRDVHESRRIFHVSIIKVKIISDSAWDIHVLHNGHHLSLIEVPAALCALHFYTGSEPFKYLFVAKRF